MFTSEVAEMELALALELVGQVGQRASFSSIGWTRLSIIVAVLSVDLI